MYTFYGYACLDIQLVCGIFEHMAVIKSVVVLPPIRRIPHLPRKGRDRVQSFIQFVSHLHDMYHVIFKCYEKYWKIIVQLTSVTVSSRTIIYVITKTIWLCEKLELPFTQRKEDIFKKLQFTKYSAHICCWTGVSFCIGNSNST